MNRQFDVELKVYLVEHGYEAHILKDGEELAILCRDFSDDHNLETLKTTLALRLEAFMGEFAQTPGVRP